MPDVWLVISVEAMSHAWLPPSDRNRLGVSSIGQLYGYVASYLRLFCRHEGIGNDLFAKLEDFGTKWVVLVVVVVVSVILQRNKSPYILRCVR